MIFNKSSFIKRILKSFLSILRQPIARQQNILFFLVKDIFLTTTVLCRWLRGNERNSPGSRTPQPRIHRSCPCTSTRWRLDTRRSRSRSARSCTIRSGPRHNNRWPCHGPRTTVAGTRHRPGHPSTWVGPDLRIPECTDRHRRRSSNCSRHRHRCPTTTAVRRHRPDNQRSRHRSAVSPRTGHPGNHRPVRISLWQCNGYLLRYNVDNRGMDYSYLFLKIELWEAEVI